MTLTEEVEFEELQARVRRARRIVVLTGAGMSAESGIPTFRDAMSGLWAHFDPAELASEEGFRANPSRVWAWYAERRAGVVTTQPNAGHLALGDFARRRPGVLTLVTQNVDDLHQRAGNTDTIRLHGDILQDQWLEPCPRRGGPPCDTGWAHPGEPPACRDCGNLLRPGVVWFGENLPLRALMAAEDACDRAELALVVGTSGAVWPAAGLAARARRAGAWVAIVNPEPTEIDLDANQLVRGTAAQVLPLLFSE